MKLYLDMIGCRLNQSELEEMARQFTALGHQLTATMEDADAAVVNTCTVTVAAAADSRKLIRRIARSGVKQIVVTGCWATMEPGQAADLPAVVQVVPNSDKDFLVSQFLSQPIGSPEEDRRGKRRVPGSRMRTRAFIKTQDGCNHRCAFCITTIARGMSRSVRMDRIIEQIRGLAASGVKEAVLTGVQLGSWGQDLPGSLDLAALVTEILTRTALPRLRLSSIEPWDVSPRLISLLRSKRVARHLHLPLQSGSAETLRRMGRAISPAGYRDLITRVRSEVPEIALTTDIIAGFPGETEAEFQESITFLQAMQFAGGHVFPYSARERTPAAAFPDPVPHPVRKARASHIREILADSAALYRKKFLGQLLPVLWEDVQECENGSCTVRGLSDTYLRVETQTSPDVWNTITPTKLVALTPKGLLGVIYHDLPVVE